MEAGEEAERERPGVEAGKLDCLEGRGSPAESVSEERQRHHSGSKRGLKGCLEARPGRDFPARLPTHPHLRFSEQEDFSWDGDACQQANACSGMERQETFYCEVGRGS